MKLDALLLAQGNFLFKHRSYLPLLIIFLALFVFINQSKTIAKSEYNLIIILSLIISFFGLGIRVITIGFAAKNTSGRNTKVGQVADELNTSGIYSIFRHPLYIGNFFMWFGAAILTCNLWFIVAFVLFYFLYYERIIFAEENFLMKKFGNVFKAWSDETNILFPNLSKYKKPKYTFNILKVLLQEKNGFTAIFMLIYLFNCLFNYFYLDKSIFPVDIWLWLLLASILIYIILKIIKRNLKKRKK